MKWYSRLNLKLKSVLFTSFIVIAICASLFLFMERIFRRSLRTEMQQQASDIAEAFQDQLSNFNDSARAESLAKRLIQESPEISRIAIYRRVSNQIQPFIQAHAIDLPRNVSLYRSAMNQHKSARHDFRYNGQEYWEFAYPIEQQDKVLGMIAVTLNFSQYKILVSALRTGTFAILIVGLIVMLVSMNLFTELTIRRPLAEIVGAMEKVKRSQFNVRVKPHSMDEIGKLAEDFNTMALSLNEAQEEIVSQNKTLEQRVRDATTELLARNLELFRAQNELQHSSRLATAGQIAAMLAHDLGSPLSSISGHLQLMLEEEQSPRSEDQMRLRLVLTQVERLSDNIRNFLTNVSGRESHFLPCNLNALLEHLVQLTSPLLMGRNIQATLELDRILPSLQADSNQLQQLFLNLIMNAIDAMSAGGELKITTNYIQKDHQDLQTLREQYHTDNFDEFARIKIRDTGLGMGPEHLKNLFSPFFSTKEFGKGTGLGLAICKEIVEVHGGSIRVVSEPGKGSEFTIFFPINYARNE